MKMTHVVVHDVNPFPPVYTFDASAAEKLLKTHFEKRINCSKRVISPFGTMFSIIEIYHIFE